MNSQRYTLVTMFSVLYFQRMMGELGLGASEQGLSDLEDQGTSEQAFSDLEEQGTSEQAFSDLEEQGTSEHGLSSEEECRSSDGSVHSVYIVVDKAQEQRKMLQKKTATVKHNIKGMSSPEPHTYPSSLKSSQKQVRGKPIVFCPDPKRDSSWYKLPEGYSKRPSGSSHKKATVFNENGHDVEYNSDSAKSALEPPTTESSVSSYAFYSNLIPDSVKIKSAGLAIKRSLSQKPKVTHLGKKGHLICRPCRQEFTNMSTLNRHRMQKHIQESLKQFTCGSCTSAFHNKTLLQRHVREVHLKVYPHHCIGCHEGFPTKERLQKHMDSAHRSGWPAYCEKCGKRLGGYEEFLEHMKEMHKYKRPQRKYNRTAPGKKHTR